MSGTVRIAVAGTLVGVGLVLVGWIDYRATRAELLALLGEQARALRQTVAAAARSNQAAGALAEAEVGARLLDNGRFLAELDRRGLLDQRLLDQFTTQNRLYRVTLFGADRSRQMVSGRTMGTDRGRGSEGAGFGRGGRGAGGAGPGLGGPGGPRGAGVGQAGQTGGPGSGRGLGLGPGAAYILDEATASAESEGLVPLRAAGSGVGSRQAAWVKRSGGGLILINVDATEVSRLQKQSSLDALVEDIATSATEVAYIVIEGGDVRIAHGYVPPDRAESAGPEAQGTESTATGGGDQVVERQVEVGGRPVLEFSGAVPVGPNLAGHLHLGLRLDGLRRAQQRMLWRMSLSLAAALALAMLALGTIWLRQRLGVVSAEHARAEAALRRRDRLAAMGELASTVAHEVRNPLNGVAMAAQRIRREYAAALEQAPGADREELSQLLGVVEGETRRIDAIIRQFLEFARPPKLAPRRTDLAAEITAVAEASRPTAASRGITLVSVTGAAGTATADPNQLRQALDNLLRNAIEATPEGGRVEISAASRADGHEIVVADSGPGIGADVLPKIFDLYFTTKADGTGVGLAVTQQIVTAHGGTIEVDTSPGAGTRMIVRLPSGIEEADHA